MREGGAGTKEMGSRGVGVSMGENCLPTTPPERDASRKGGAWSHVDESKGMLTPPPPCRRFCPDSSGSAEAPIHVSRKRNRINDSQTHKHEDSQSRIVQSLRERIKRLKKNLSDEGIARGHYQAKAEWLEVLLRRDSDSLIAKEDAALATMTTISEALADHQRNLASHFDLLITAIDQRRDGARKLLFEEQARVPPRSTTKVLSSIERSEI